MLRTLSGRIALWCYPGGWLSSDSHLIFLMLPHSSDEIICLMFVHQIYSNDCGQIIAEEDINCIIIHGILVVLVILPLKLHFLLYKEFFCSHPYIFLNYYWNKIVLDLLSPVYFLSEENTTMHKLCIYWTDTDTNMWGCKKKSHYCQRGFLFHINT